jgi:hypothetical protein
MFFLLCCLTFVLWAAGPALLCRYPTGALSPCITKHLEGATSWRTCWAMIWCGITLMTHGMECMLNKACLFHEDNVNRMSERLEACHMAVVAQQQAARACARESGRMKIQIRTAAVQTARLVSGLCRLLTRLIKALMHAAEFLVVQSGVASGTNSIVGVSLRACKQVCLRALRTLAALEQGDALDARRFAARTGQALAMLVTTLTGGTGWSMECSSFQTSFLLFRYMVVFLTSAWLVLMYFAHDGESVWRVLMVTVSSFDQVKTSTTVMLMVPVIAKIAVCWG